MLVVLPFCDKDIQQAIALADWIAELGGAHDHQCLAVHHEMNPIACMGVLEPLREAFRRVVDMTLRDKDPKRWPQGPNLMFRRAAKQIQETAVTPWLWLEPDAIPTHPDWLNRIEEEYTRGGRPFMGAEVHHGDTPVHMTGIAVYPHNAPTLAPLLVSCEEAAFDMNAKGETLPRMHRTALIQHVWRAETFATAADLQRLDPQAVIFHQCKDGTLIQRLREDKNLGTDWKAPLGEPDGPEGEPGIEPAAFASASPSPVSPVSEGPTPEAQPGEAGGGLAAKLFDQMEIVDMMARLKGEPPEFGDVHLEMIDRMTRHLALIAKDPAGRRAVLAQLGMVGLRAELHSVTTPPAKRRKKGRK